MEKEAMKTPSPSGETASAPPSRQSEEPRPGSPAAVLRLAGLFREDQQAMIEHIEAIYAKRKRQQIAVVPPTDS